MGFTFNPVLSEIQSHLQAMSPPAQAAVKMANPSLPSPGAISATQAPSVIPPGMLLPHPDAEPAPVSMSTPSPSISMPNSTPSLVTGPKRGQEMMSNGQSVPIGTTAGDTVERQRLLGEKPGVDNIYHGITNSRLGQAHPFLGKLLGGVAQTAGTIGDTLVSNAAPGIGREIPGTTANHNMLLGQANTALGQDVSNAQKEAQTANENATAQHTQAETNKLEQPEVSQNERPYTISTDKGELQWDGQHWNPIQVNGETANAAGKETPAHLQKVEGEDGTFANYNPATGVFTDQSGKSLPNFKAKDKALHGAYGGFGPAFLAYRMLNSAYNENPALLPYIAPLITKMLSQSGGGAPAGMEGALSAVPVGQPQNESGTPIGLRMPGAPTGSTRSRGQFAGEVLPTMHEAEGEIDKVGDKLGPFMGRISDLVTGKVGAYGPEFSALQTDLHNIATGWGRLHGNSVETMKQFYDDLNASKDPANLKAKLERYEKQAETYKAGGEGRPPASDGASSGATELEIGPDGNLRAKGGK